MHEFAPRLVGRSAGTTRTLALAPRLGVRWWGMRAAVVMALVAAPACGRLDFNSAAVSGATDGGIDGLPDARCPTRWVPVRTLEELNSSATDWSPAWGQDGNQIVFQSNRAGTDDLYVALRSGNGDRFDPPIKITELSTPANEKAPTLSHSGLEIVYDSGGALMRATRGTPTGRFSTPGQLVLDGFGADLGSDDLDLIYAINNAGMVNLVIRSRASAIDNRFGAPVVIDKISMPEGGWPSLSRDGLELFYEGGSSSPMYTATRPSRGAPFTSPVPIPELGAVSDPDISPDGRFLLYVINATNEITLARRTCAAGPQPSA
jgi:hypothetical protein